MEKNELIELSKKIEALLFSYAETLSYKKCTQVLGVEFQDLKEAVQILKERYEKNSALEIVEINLSLQMLVKAEYSEYVDELFINDKGKGLSRAQLEVLSIIAYRQSVTKREIERIRGTNSARIVQSLIEADLVEAVGKKDAPGLPVLYGTTDTFLIRFGLKNISELPDLDDGFSLFNE